ncbi:hypothetical protein, no similarity [Maudiozyma saulgeensis]|uniref:Uncharacterized protein n=1 Tax=Maudiozyma saulgeensis TaxID=1789683 RepID=A0A1X7RAA0_9SACH|nr:hypothetical protein, no similarity [Kazachstania saulgeensis]
MCVKCSSKEQSPPLNELIKRIFCLSLCLSVRLIIRCQFCQPPTASCFNDNSRLSENRNWKKLKNISLFYTPFHAGFLDQPMISEKTGRFIPRLFSLYLSYQKRERNFSIFLAFRSEKVTQMGILICLCAEPSVPTSFNFHLTKLGKIKTTQMRKLPVWVF